jgi:hypothetical protein
MILVIFLDNRAPKQNVWTVQANSDTATNGVVVAADASILPFDPAPTTIIVFDRTAARAHPTAIHRLPIISSSEKTFGFGVEVVVVSAVVVEVVILLLLLLAKAAAPPLPFSANVGVSVQLRLDILRTTQTDPAVVNKEKRKPPTITVQILAIYFVFVCVYKETDRVLCE